MDSLSHAQRNILERVIAAFAALDGIVAIALGGSHARGRARPDSDLDICLFYSELRPFDTAAVCAIARELSDQPDPVVTGIGDWGPWVDGGGWLVMGGQRVDLLYRAVEKVERTLTDAQAGRYESHYEQQPPFGYFGPTLLGEVVHARPLIDRRGVLTALKARVDPMPDALARAVVQNNLWSVDFGLAAFAPKFAASGQVLALAGCLTRFGNALVHTLFALNRTYYMGDKTALVEIAEFPITPPDFVARLRLILSETGSNPDMFNAVVAAFHDLFNDTKALAGEGYAPFWPLDAITAA
jgi:predicted nucleotidyltransferase